MTNKCMCVSTCRYADVIDELLRGGAVPCKGLNPSSSSELAVAAVNGEFELLGKLLVAVNPRWKETRRIPPAVRWPLDDAIATAHGVNGGLAEALALNAVALQEEQFVRRVWIELRADDRRRSRQSRSCLLYTSPSPRDRG